MNNSLKQRVLELINKHEVVVETINGWVFAMSEDVWPCVILEDVCVEHI